jgi:hypothetical protein
MIPFFFTMPISRMMPMMATTLRSCLKENERQQCAHAGGRQRGKNRDGVNEALVQDAEHDIHRSQRGKNQQALIGERPLK